MSTFEVDQKNSSVVQLLISCNVIVQNSSHVITLMKGFDPLQRWTTVNKQTDKKYYINSSS